MPMNRNVETNRVCNPDYLSGGLIYFFNRYKNHLSVLKDEIGKDAKVNLKVPANITNSDPIITLAKDKLYKRNIWQDDKAIHKQTLCIPKFSGKSETFE